MSKIIAMILARLGSQRIKKKNLRLINNKPLVGYIIEAALKTGIFSDIYLNSESEIFKEIALDYNIKFYQRPSEFSTNTATNDEFANDFMKNIPGDILIQMLPTSPLIQPSEIKAFCLAMEEQSWDTLISVENKQIGCVLKNRPLNFDLKKQVPPSQEVTPVQVYLTVLMGWRYENYFQNMKKFNAGYHGGEGKIGYFPMTGLSTIDIDNESDFVLAEQIVNSLG